MSEPKGAARLKRRMIDRVLALWDKKEFGEPGPLITLQHRFASEAAREEARRFCDEMVAEDIRARRQRVAA